MKQYLDILEDTLKNGWDRVSRPRLDGKQVIARTSRKFAREMRFDLTNGKFPIVTTKPVPFRLVALELAAFIAATDDVREMNKVGLHIWDGNAYSEWWEKYREYKGHLGRIYGVEWIHFSSPWDPTGEVNQLAWLINMIRANPNDRRMIICGWNPAAVQANKVSLPPCHVMVHFDIIDGKIHFMMYQRSCDMVLGVPFNTPSYELFGSLIGHITGYPLAEFVHILGDHHIYENHYEAARTQIERKPLEFPTLWINPEIKEIDDFRLYKMVKRVETEDDFVSGRRKPITVIDDYVQLVGYKYHEKLPGDQRMAV